MDFKKIIKFYFKPKSVMSQEEISNKTFPVKTAFYKSLSKGEKAAYWSFRIGFIVIICYAMRFLLG